MNNKAHLRPKDYDSNGDIIPMACKEEKGDLISREALKKKFERLVDETIPYGGVAVNDMRELIDNAPTVPLPDFKEGYKQAIIDGKTNFFRLKGKWVSKPNDEFCYCSECNNPEFGCLNFCRYCGADMRSDTK